MVKAFMKEFATGMLAVAKFSVIISALPQIKNRFAVWGIHMKPNMKKLAVRKRHRESPPFWPGPCTGSGQMPTRPKLNRFHPIAKFRSMQIEFAWKLDQAGKYFRHIRGTWRERSSQFQIQYDNAKNADLIQQKKKQFARRHSVSSPPRVPRSASIDT